MSDKNLVAVATPLHMIQKAMETPDFDVEKLSRMMELQERWEANEAKKQFAIAMAAFQGQCPRIAKSSDGHNSKYAKYETIMRVIQPILSANGLSINFDTKFEAGLVTAIAKVSHASGHTKEYTFSCIVDEKMRINESQKTASANSYAKRYCLVNALNLVTADEDDDGASTGVIYISEVEQANITDLLAEKKTDKAKFLKWLKVNSVSEIPASSYDKAMNALRAKK